MQSQIAFGETKYNTHCRSCHGPGGRNGSETLVAGNNPLWVRQAPGIEPGSSPLRNMGTLAAQLENPVRDANAIGYYLCDAGGLDINDTSVCLP